MKHRTGFVSNSSSSSFIVFGKRIPGVNDQIIDLLTSAVPGSKRERLGDIEMDLQNTEGSFKANLSEKQDLLQREDFVFVELMVGYDTFNEGNLGEVLLALAKVKGLMTDVTESDNWATRARKLF